MRMLTGDGAGGAQPVHSQFGGWLMLITARPALKRLQYSLGSTARSLRRDGDPLAPPGEGVARCHQIGHRG